MGNKNMNNYKKPNVKFDKDKNDWTGFLINRDEIAAAAQWRSNGTEFIVVGQNDWGDWNISPVENQDYICLHSLSHDALIAIWCMQSQAYFDNLSNDVSREKMPNIKYSGYFTDWTGLIVESKHIHQIALWGFAGDVFVIDGQNSWGDWNVSRKYEPDYVCVRTLGYDELTTLWALQAQEYIEYLESGNNG